MSAAPVVVTVPDEEYAAALADLDGVDAVVWDMEGPLERATDVRLAVMPYMTRLTVSDISVGLDSLEVVQIQSAGYEGFVDGLPHGVALCNAAGVHDASTAGSPSRSPWPRSGRFRSSSQHSVIRTGRRRRCIGRWPTRACSCWATATSVGPSSPVPVLRSVGDGGQASRARRATTSVDTVHGIDELPSFAGAGADVLDRDPVTDATRGLVDADLLARPARRGARRQRRARPRGRHP